MIISRTPFRLSFFGGGTDLPSFFKEEEGAVISTTINKYMYITVNDRFDDSYRLSYSKTEICDAVEQIHHPIFKVVLDRHGEKGQGLEIISMADVPSGTGLGSSSSFTVGLLNAMHAHKGEYKSADELAQEACQIEMVDLKEPVGKQDQYAAAHGGFSVMRFFPDGNVRVDPVLCATDMREKIEASVVMYYTGLTRSAGTVLEEQNSRAVSKMESLRRMRQMVFQMKTLLEQGGDLAAIGGLLDESWQLKRSLASGISNPEIDRWYKRGMEAGALGGKLLGAGGGGFLMFLCAPEKQPQLDQELSELRRIPVQFEKWGSRIIFVGK